MGNCISKINKDRFFVYEEYMKNKTSLEKERQAVPLKWVAEGEHMWEHILSWGFQK